MGLVVIMVLMVRSPIVFNSLILNTFSRSIVYCPTWCLRVRNQTSYIGLLRNSCLSIDRTHGASHISVLLHFWLLDMVQADKIGIDASWKNLYLLNTPLRTLRYPFGFSPNLENRFIVYRFTHACRTAQRSTCNIVSNCENHTIVNQ